MSVVNKTPKPALRAASSYHTPDDGQTSVEKNDRPRKTTSSCAAERTTARALSPGREGSAEGGQRKLERRMSEEGDEDAMHGIRGLCIREKVGLPKQEREETVGSDEERVNDTANDLQNMLAQLEAEAAALERDNQVESLSPRRKQKGGLSGLIKGMMGSGTSPEKRNNFPSIRRESIQLEEPLGEGSCAVVCRGTWRGVEVAAKVLKDDAQYQRKGSTLEEARETLLQELEMLVLVNHPNMVGVIGTVDWQGPKPILVQELMQCSLKQYYDKMNAVEGVTLGGKPWMPDDYLAVRWCWGLAQAIAFLHSLAPCLIHRDVKPDNIMLDCDNNLKLGDLGLSRQIPKKLRKFMGSSKKKSYKMTGDTGSLRYMAPEVLDVDHEGMAFYNESVDVYSMGMVMFFIIAGEIPFVAHRAREAAKRAILGFRPSLKELTNYSPDLLALIKASWAHEHADRPMADDVAVKLSELKRAIHERKTAVLMEKIEADGAGDDVQARARSLSVCHSPVSGKSSRTYNPLSSPISALAGSRSSSPSRAAGSRGASPTTRGSRVRWPFSTTKSAEGSGEAPERMVSSVSNSAKDGDGSQHRSFLSKTLSRSLSPLRRPRNREAATATASSSNNKGDTSPSRSRGSRFGGILGGRASSPIERLPSAGGVTPESSDNGPAGGRVGRSRGMPGNAPKERLSSGI